MIALMYERIGWPLENVLKLGLEVVEPLPKSATLLLQVHDALIVECPAEMVDEVVGVMKRVMEQPFRELGGFSIPVSASVGDSWGEMEGWKPVLS
jgi:DNA polymerase I-like protein with 3'-5' exonuclease and polymerase domains